MKQQCFGPVEENGRPPKSIPAGPVVQRPAGTKIKKRIVTWDTVSSVHPHLFLFLIQIIGFLSFRDKKKVIVKNKIDCVLRF